MRTTVICLLFGSSKYGYHINSKILKGNQTMKLGQLMEYNNRNIFLQNYAKNEVGRLVSDLFLFFKKA